MTDFYDNAIEELTNKGIQYTVLKIALNSSDENLIQMYENKIREHNESMTNNIFSNAGFDLFIPNDIFIQSYETSMVSMNVKVEMSTYDGHPCAFYMYPRSSISKTPLLLANSVGIIDSGYRGELIGAFRSLSASNYKIEQYTRLLQITNAFLTPIIVKLVDESELSTTERGTGGFGSTGV
jgi:dUTP pyrophosphatase